MWRIVQQNDIPQFLDSLDLPGIAKYVKSESCKNVFVMAGAGISTSAGIPDFRSPDTGLYANLARLNLPYPEAVFDISFFKRNPRPFYVLAHELAPGKFRPTLTHSFIRLLAEKGLLHTCFTQNIDTLERAAGVSPEKIVEAHGSFADQHCVNCGASYPHDKIKKKIDDQEIPICEKQSCGGYVKPDIVFFGENLPAEFFRGIGNLRDADLLIVMGTSLTVHPFASLTGLVPEECPRLLINLDHVGGWGSRANDVACLMPCDKAVRQLCELLGWGEELKALWAETDTSTPKPIVAAFEDMVHVKESEGEREGEASGEPEAKEKEAKRVAAKDETKKVTREEEAEEGTKGEAVDSDGKTVSEELLGDLVDKLAETISEIRLEEEINRNHEGRTEQAIEGDTSRAEDTSDIAKSDVSGASKTEESDSSLGTSLVKEPEAPPATEQTANSSDSIQTVKP